MFFLPWHDTTQLWVGSHFSHANWHGRVAQFDSFILRIRAKWNQTNDSIAFIPSSYHKTTTNSSIIMKLFQRSQQHSLDTPKVLDMDLRHCPELQRLSLEYKIQQALKEEKQQRNKNNRWSMRMSRKRVASSETSWGEWKWIHTQTNNI